MEFEGINEMLGHVFEGILRVKRAFEGNFQQISVSFGKLRKHFILIQEKFEDSLNFSQSFLNFCKKNSKYF